MKIFIQLTSIEEKTIQSTREDWCGAGLLMLWCNWRDQGQGGRELSLTTAARVMIRFVKLLDWHLFPGSFKSMNSFCDWLLVSSNILIGCRDRLYSLGLAWLVCAVYCGVSYRNWMTTFTLLEKQTMRSTEAYWYWYCLDVTISLLHSDSTCLLRMIIIL